MNKIILEAQAQGRGNSLIRDAFIMKTQREMADKDSVARLRKYFEKSCMGCNSCIFNKPEVCEVAMRSGYYIKLCDLVTLVGGRDNYNNL